MLERDLSHTGICEDEQSHFRKQDISRKMRIRVMGVLDGGSQRSSGDTTVVVVSKRAFNVWHEKRLSELTYIFLSWTYSLVSTSHHFNSLY